ncbi:hypothetical protein QWY20_13030 [Alkalimonas sp. MEB108]|uniref:Uncharacterized protein n=1 Tax=Alkalimonas cellulosilytica TaxID=3058395 RepID=A0ABU7J773_9GAMM|nr:hypothetical protein [Alkalimonas sp. MEB108]MEE2002380.1 hypothetical protein [Alkalimonas sp. MEB108]
MSPPRMRQRNVSKASAATDQHILRLHSAMAEKLLAEPWRISGIRQTLEQRYQAGQIKHGGYIHWHSILDCIDQPDVFRTALLDNGERMIKLRRRTVLVGILTEQERMALLG